VLTSASPLRARIAPKAQLPIAQVERWQSPVPQHRSTYRPWAELLNPRCGHFRSRKTSARRLALSYPARGGFCRRLNRLRARITRGRSLSARQSISKRLDRKPYGPYTSCMAKQRKCGAEEARAHLPELLERAHRGEVTVITRHGRPLAKVVPVDGSESRKAKLPVLLLEGSGRGLWGRNSRRTLKRLRDEW
jgi:prevent-host-death family protein